MRRLWRSPVTRVRTIVSRSPSEPRSTRLRVVIASLIATTSLVAAVGAWRASLASSASSGADRKGFADSVTRSRAVAEIRAALAATLLDYARARSYAEQAKALRAQARRAPPAERARLVAIAESKERLEQVARNSIDADALRPDGTLDLDRKFDFELSLQRSTQDMDPREEFARGNALNTKTERLVGITALLVSGALFFTLAQVSRRRVYLLYLAAGAVVLGTSTILLIVVEVGT